MAPTERDPLLRTPFTPPPRGDHPTTWSPAYKSFLVLLLAFQAFTVTFTCISVVPVASTIIADLSPAVPAAKLKASSVLLVTIWELGEAAGPLLIAPLSELYGRRPVYNVANLLFIASVAASAFAPSVEVLIAARFTTGVAVAGNVLNPAIVGDVFGPESRGSAMSILMLAPLLGGAVGPAIAGAIAQSAGWREIMYMALALAVGCEVLFLTLFKETYGVVIEKKRRRVEGAVVEEESGAGGDEEVAVAKEVARGGSALWLSVLRPASVFYSSAVLQIMSLYGGLSFTFFYTMSTTLPDILATRYSLSPALVGVSFLSFSKSRSHKLNSLCIALTLAGVGSFIAIIVSNRILDRIHLKLKRPEDATSAPENRLPLMIIGAIILPLVVTLYGWSAELVLPLPVMLFSVSVLGFAVLITIVSLMAYIVDAFGIYSASALTSQLVTRCLLGTFLPLLTPLLTDAIGWGWGFTVLAATCLVLAPVPVMVFWYGREWRQRSKYTKDV